MNIKREEASDLPLLDFGNVMGGKALFYYFYMNERSFIIVLFLKDNLELKSKAMIRVKSSEYFAKEEPKDTKETS